MVAQKQDEMQIWSLMRSRISNQSQSKVREDPTFEGAFGRLDSVKRWTFISRSHLTHIYGDDDSMAIANVHD